MSVQASFGTTITNKTSDCSIALQQAVVENASFELGTLPATVDAGSSADLQGVMWGGLFSDAEDSGIQIPFTITNNTNKKTLDGQFKFYFVDGDSYPDYLAVEVDCSGQSSVQQFSISWSDDYLDPATPLITLGSVSILLADAGFSVAFDSGASITLTDLSDVAELVAG